MALSEKWGTGVWTRPPRRVRAEGDGLHVEAEEGSDFWLRTLYGFEHDDGHALLASTSPAAAVEVSFDLAGLSEQYDQAAVAGEEGFHKNQWSVVSDQWSEKQSTLISAH